MATVQPEGESLRKAVKWISEARQAAPESRLARLVEEACVKFDLSPAEAEFLMKTLKSPGA